MINTPCDIELFINRIKELQKLFGKVDPQGKEQIVIDLGTFLDLLDPLVPIEDEEESDTLKKFSVTVVETYQFNQVSVIEAKNEEEAREIALEKFECDWEQSLLLPEETSVEIERV